MDWSDIQGMDQATVDALFNAGIASAAGLAAVDDEADLARRAGIPVERVLSFCQQAREKIEIALADAGIQGPEDLARCDPEELATRTNLPAAQLQLFVEQARRATGVAPPPPPAPPPDAILLLETSSKARVRLEGAVTEVPIVTARATDDAVALLASTQGDAVVLQEQANMAPARVNGRTLASLPLFRIDGPLEERVRVASLKAPPPEAEPPARKGDKSVFSRFKHRS